MKLKNEILNKKFLIYGFGKSGISSFKYLNKKNQCFIFDDEKKKLSNKFKKFFISKSKILNNNFDNIIISPGINIHRCQLSNFLKKNQKKIITDLDIFYKFNPEILTITITGTNGKSTTSKLLYDILKNHNYDARLTGNIGNPILEEKKINKKTIFVVEASSYQLAYSKYFKSKFSVIINISPDHLERHNTMKNYTLAKLKCVTKQNKNDIAITANDSLLKNYLRTKNIKSKIIFVSKNKYSYLRNKLKNYNFINSTNFQNINFLFELSKYMKLNLKIVLKAINNFKPLKFRQEVIFDSKNLKIVNDSKSTTLSSTTPFLETNEKIYWILGGLFKKGDKFNLNKRYYKNLEAYIYGKDRYVFFKLFKNKFKVTLSKDLKNTLKLIPKFKNLKRKVIILFSPSAASFDQYKNFEDRGRQFNILIKKYLPSK
tara:strand:- start:8396 stop:9685 length:1290 start_codon:yes stop_codon:yes gene_type:complete